MVQSVNDILDRFLRPTIWPTEEEEKKKNASIDFQSLSTQFRD